ncbi:hypothetical protein OBV_17370 [Oscillibacter valericigenes Sjm18-20]|nr:hypothetical protein OBV_17370 [Oscillibacter valericigenes Sjm18-20]
MLFKNDEARLELEIVNYEFSEDSGAPDGDDRNWLVLRGTYTTEDGLIIKDSNSCLLTSELNELTAGLKVLKSGIRDIYDSDFSEPYFLLSARSEVDGRYVVDVSFTLPNTMEDIENAELRCVMTTAELSTLIDELDTLCKKFPDRK